MTLDGLTVDEWLRDQHASPGPSGRQPVAVAHVPAPSREPRQKRVASRTRNVLIWCAAVAVGAWLAVPVLGRSTACPPSGEGATYCHLQHNVLAGAMTFLLAAAGVVIACRLILGLPAFVTRVRADGLLPRSPSANIHGDPLLIAANRGHIS